MKNRSYLLCVWSGPAGFFLFFVAMFSAHFIPLLPPTAGAPDVVNLYQNHAFGIRFGAATLTVGAALLLAFIGAISAQMKRIEGFVSPLTYTQLAAGIFGTIPLIVAPEIWTAIAFRPDRDPNTVLALNDFAWVIMTLPGAPIAIQVFAMALVIFDDRSEKPLFPRWFGHLNFWVGVSLLPGLFIGFFHTGPFAWNGIIGFMVPAVGFTIWVGVTTYILLRAGKDPRGTARPSDARSRGEG